MKPSPALALLLGLWLGSTAAVLSVVAYSFSSVERSVSGDEQQAESPDAAPDKRRMSPLFVHTAKLNRALFHAWNRAQLGLAALTLLVALLRFPRAGLIFSLMAAALIVLALNFYLEPEVARLSRQLDLVPRDAPGRAVDFRRFDLLHQLSELAEGSKTLILLLAGFLAIRRPAKAVNPRQ